MSSTPLRPGDSRSGFKVRTVEKLEELNTTLVQLDHVVTGGRWVHLQNGDPNNLFAVAFRTPPADSSGIAHILEHTALCGSRRYPVRDPFFSMLKRSMNTFMNAMTAGDWTVYPFATQNRRDFGNLLGIYLDAAFFPLLRENDFLQEGHRLEFTEPGRTDSPLVYKGVVYNEMKGAMASPSSLLYRRMCKVLYPTTCYRFNSGGEPDEIPNLTWNDLREFHARYYHPSNAWFYSYGNIPVEEHLDAVAEQVMAHFGPLEIDSAIPPEKRLAQPVRATEYFPVDPGEEIRNKAMFQVAWLACDIEESIERLSLNLLSMLLLGNPAAPLHKALLDSRLGGNLAPGSGYQDDIRTTYFAAGLQATEADRAGNIEEVIFDTLNKTVQEGFHRDRIDGVIHRLEFSQREVSGDRYPYALVLLMRLLGPWMHADDPVSVLRIDTILDSLREKCRRRTFFPELIERYLLGNPHRASLTLAPDREMQRRIEETTARHLAGIAGELSQDEKIRILHKAEELRQNQEQEEDLSCLPTLGLADIPEKEQPVSWTGTEHASVEIEWFDQPTNGIVYFAAHLPITGLPPEQFPYLPIYASLVTQLGAAGKNYMQTAEEIEAHTGGIHFNTEILDDPDRPDLFDAAVSLRGKALNQKQDQLFRILGDFLVEPDFSDLERVRTVLRQLETSFENAIPGSGHLYAARAGAGFLSHAARLREMWSGISLLHLLRRLNALPDSDLERECARFREIASFLARRGRVRCAVTGERAVFETVSPHLERFIESVPDRPEPPRKGDTSFSSGPGRFGWTTSVPVSYVTRTFRTVPYTHPDSAPLLVLAKILRSGYLHREIREKGGAYGGLATCNVEGGLFSLLSYRDPHISRTFGVYDDAARWAAEGTFSDEVLTEAKLSVFADLDRPLSPGGRGIQEFANNCQGLTLEKRQDLRRRVLACTSVEIARAARNYLRDNGERVDSVLSNEEMLKKMSAEVAGDPFTISKI